MENNDHKYRIALLLARKSAGVITESEADELRGWRDMSDVNGELCEKWEEAEGLQEDFRIYSGIDAERAQKDIERRIAIRTASAAAGRTAADPVPRPANKARRRSLSRIALLSASAAALLICLYLGLDRLRPEGEGEGASLISLITPGVPVLYFEDMAVSLDNALISTGRGEIRITSGGTEHVLRYDANADVKPAVSIVVPKGRIFDLTLEDGTSVYMNAGSTLRFPISFGGGLREVWLDGEAYFIAAEDPDRPLRVITDNQTVQVVGTQFNVNAYSESDFTATTVFEGRVKAMNGDNEEILTPGMQAVSGDDKWVVQSVKTSNIAAWRNDLVNLEGKPLQTVMSELSRWYDFRVEYENERVKEIMFRGTVPRYGSFDKVLELMEKTGEVKFEVRGETIRVMDYHPEAEE